MVAGAPGSGKSTLARLLCEALDPVPARLDKDTLFAGFSTEVLTAHGRSFGEREGPWYDEHIKVHEYAGMTAAAREVRALGCPVLLDGPFTTQIRDPAAWARWAEDLGGEPVHLIWVRSDAASLRERLVSRGEGRDSGKLAAFDAYLARIRPDEPPPVAHREVDNRLGAPALAAQVEAVLAATDHGQGVAASDEDTSVGSGAGLVTKPR